MQTVIRILASVGALFVLSTHLYGFEFSTTEHIQITYDYCYRTVFVKFPVLQTQGTVDRIHDIHFAHAAASGNQPLIDLYHKSQFPENADPDDYMKVAINGDDYSGIDYGGLDSFFYKFTLPTPEWAITKVHWGTPSTLQLDNSDEPWHIFYIEFEIHEIDLPPGSDFKMDITGFWNGNGSNSNEVTINMNDVSTFLTAPTAPVALMATQNECHQVTLTWTNLETQHDCFFDEFQVFRDNAPLAEGTVPFDAGMDSYTFVDDDLPSGASYSYKVRLFVNTDNYSLFTPPMSGKTHDPPADIQDLDVTGITCDGDVTLGWTNGSIYSDIVVTMDPDSANPTKEILSGTAVTHTMSIGTGTNPRRFSVAGVDECEDTTTIIYTDPVVTPQSPGSFNFPAPDTSAGTIVLNWANSTHATSYKVIRKSPEGQVEFTTNASQYVDDGVSTCIQYAYKIEAINACGTQTNNGGFKNAPVLQPNEPTLNPQGLICSKGYFPDRVELDWERPDDLSFDHYKIFRGRLDGNDSTQIGEVSKNAVHFVDAYAEAGTLYRYYVVSTSECNGVPSSSNAMTDIGFRLPIATVGGNVSFENGQGVMGVQVTVDRVEGNIGRSIELSGAGSLQLNSLYSDGSDLALASNMTVELYLRQNMSGSFEVFRHRQGSSSEYGLHYDDAAGGFVAYFNDGSQHKAFFDFDGDLESAGFVHVAWVKAGSTLSLYINGDAVTPGPEPAYPAIPSTNTLMTLGENFVGYLDEMRVWSVARTADEIALNHNRFLLGDEPGMMAYWGANEGIGEGVYDVSGINEVFNANHLIRVGDAEWEAAAIPTTGQLGAIAYTDSVGNYIVKNVRYTGQGNTFSINPFYKPENTPHQFDPVNTTVFLGEGAIVENGIDFVDISSFEVKASVYYQEEDSPCLNTTANIYIDGVIALEDGLPVQPNQHGQYIFRVPIGKHTVSVRQGGHVFEYDGLFPTPEGEPFDYQEDFFGEIKFVDLTTLRIVGRVVGGTREGDKKPTFHKSINNIGMAGIQFSSTNGCHEPDMVTTDSASGEYAIDLLPYTYAIHIHMVHPQNDLFANVNIEDFSIIPAETLVIDTVTNAAGGFLGVDSSYFHYRQDFIHRVTPSLDVVQAADGEPLGGEEALYIENPLDGSVDTIPLDGFGYPVFIGGAAYPTIISAFESYLNYDADMDNPVEDRVPVTDGTLIVENQLGNEAGIGMDIEEQIELNSPDGDTLYTFIGSIPEISDENPSEQFTKPFNVTLITPKGNTAWMPGGQEFRGYVFGVLPVEGSSFITEGPQTVDYILRDPPGSNSSASFSTSESYTKAKSWHTSLNGNVEQVIKVKAGVEFQAGGGVGAIVLYKTKVEVEASLKNTISTSVNAQGQYVETTSFTESISTSSASNLTGAPSDLFYGKSYNFLFGAAYELTMIEAVECALPGTPCLPAPVVTVGGVDYRMGVRNTLFMVPQGFATTFIFSQYQIENDVIPSLENLRNTLITEPGNDYSVSEIHPEDPAFGLNNDDPRLADFGYNPNLTDPMSTENADFIGESYNYSPPAGEIPEDRVRWYNQQIRLWKEALARNEREKMEARVKRNISFDAGATFHFEESTSNSETHTEGYELSMSRATSIVAGAEFAGVGISQGGTLQFGQTSGFNFSQGESSSTTYGYTLADNNAGDFFSIDVKDGGHGNGPVFALRGGESMCPWEQAVVTKYYEPGSTMSESTIRREWPDIDVEPATVVDVPEHQPASFTLKLRNLSPTGDIQWYGLRVLEGTNPDAKLSIDGISPNRVFEVPPGQTIEKILQLTKGSFDTYENIGLVFYSTCEYDAFQNGGMLVSADTIYISAYFVPTCSPVVVTVPDDLWIQNVNDGDVFSLQVSGFDQDYLGFQNFQIQYKPTFSSNWQGIETFWSGSVPSGQQGQTLPAGANNRAFAWDISQIPDGPYDIRAVSHCALNQYQGPAVTGIIDRVRPHAFGNPQPADGVLDPNDELLVRFNETIDPTLVSRSNFSIRGVLNGSELRHETAVQLDGFNDHVQAPAGTRLGAHPMTIEMWVKRTSDGAATLWSQGDGPDSNVVIGINATDNLYFRLDNMLSISSAKIEDDDDWHHVAVTLNDMGIVSFFKTGVFQSSELLDSIISIPGQMTIGKNAWNGSGALAGYIHEVRIWRTERTIGQIQSQMLERLSGNEPGLSILWPMDEGVGTEIRDIVRKKTATLFGDWAILPSGFAMSFDGDDDRLDVTPSGIVFTRQHNFTLEFWVKSGDGADEQTILSNGRGDGTDNLPSGWSITLAPAGQLHVHHGGQTFVAIPDNIRDDNWHHVALAMNRNGNLNAYLDGLLRTSLNGTAFGEFAGPRLWVGARGWPVPGDFQNDQYFDGDLDELRVWNTVRTRQQLQLDMQHRLLGDEPGLMFYLPFEHYEEVSGVPQLTTNLMDESGNDLAIAVIDEPMHEALDPNIKLPRPVVDVNFTYAINDDEIILTVIDDPVRVENVILDISVMGLRDLRGNTMAGPITWTAFVNQNQLHWTTSEIVFEKPEKEPYTFEAEIENSGGIELTFEILNLPEWLTADPAVGVIGPVSTRTIHFTVDPNVNIGDYSADVNLLSGQGFNDKLIVDMHVFGVPPEWTFDPVSYAHSMSIVADLDILGELSDDPLDRVVAYIDGEVRGLATMEYMPEYDRYEAFLDIYSDDPSGDVVTFKVWDASTGETFAGVIFEEDNIESMSIEFEANMLIGTPVEPARFIVNQDRIQSIPLNAGWTWISFNVLSEEFPDLDLFFDELQLENNDLVMSDSREASYVPSSGWGGSLSSPGLEITGMYKCNFMHAGILQVVGPRVVPADYPLDIESGWNWLPFLGGERIEINEALADFDEVMPGDQIKSQTQFAVYDGIQEKWLGTLRAMEPGMGYMLYATDDGELIYPRVAAFTPEPDIEVLPPRTGIGWRSGSDSALEVNKQHNMTLVARISVDGDMTQQLKVVAFIRGEMVDVAQAMEASDDGAPLYFITLQGDHQADEVYFEAYDLADHFIGFVKETVDWNADTQLGSLSQPYVLHITNHKQMEVQVSPNPFANRLDIVVTTDVGAPVTVSLYDMHGKMLRSRDTGETKAGVHRIIWSGNEFDAISLMPGTYLLKVISGDESYQQLVVKQ